MSPEVLRRGRLAASTGIIGCLIGGALASAPTPADAASNATPTGSSSSIVAAFQKPALDARPMARMWFPDAGAGDSAEGLAQVADQINDLADQGFGGVEIQYLADETKYTNADTKTIGYGSPNWKKIVKELLETANAVPGGFKIDFTITSHWPPAVNNIDPNDAGQQKETSQAYAKITADDLAAGKADLPLPTTKTKDAKNSTFVFTDDLSSATIAKVTAVDASGNPTLSVDSLDDVTAATRKKTVTAAEAADGTAYHVVNGVRYAGTAAGVPDEAYATAHGLDYQATIDAFGPDPTDPDFSGKIDADGNRKRMADWQYDYSTNLGAIDALADYAPSSGSSLAVGDYVLIGNYERGTGQVLSGGGSVQQYNREYVTNYFTDKGVEAITKFWDDHILDDDVRALLRENGKLGTSIFEDSIELSKASSLWTAGLLDEIKDYTGTDAAKYAPALVTNSTLKYDDTTTVTRVTEDYNLTLGHLYETQHASLISDWAKGFGYTYRAQAYPLPGLDVGAAAAAVDIPEGDNATAGDGLRTLAGVNNLAGRSLLSMEAVTFTAEFNSQWVTIMQQLNSAMSNGVNRAILHGSAFGKTFNDYNDAWPGWNFDRFTSMNDRQAWWDDVTDFSDYVSRNQAVLQAGKADVDFAVLVGTEDGYELQSGNSMQALLDRGYSYNLLTEPLLDEDSATVTDGVLDPSGAGYRGLVVKEAAQLSVATVKKLITYAQNGLPIVLLDSDLDRVYGSSKEGNSDADLAAALAELEDEPTVKSGVQTDTAVLSYFQHEGVKPAASFDVPYLEASHRRDDAGDFYYIYNAGAQLAAAASAGDTQVKVVRGSAFKAGDQLTIDTGNAEETVEVTSATTATGDDCSFAPDTGTVCNTTLTLAQPLSHDHVGPVDSPGGYTGTQGALVSAVKDTRVTLHGSGTPYVLDANTGKITPIAEYTRDGDDVTFDLSLGGEQATIVGILPAGAGLPEAGSLHATATTGGTVVYDADGRLALRATTPGTYQVSLSDGTTRSVSIGDVPGAVDLSEGWDLSIESWGPDPEANVADPTISKKTTVAFDDVSLTPWKDLDATDQQLATLGVDGMDQVAGIGTYTKTFTLPSGWTASTGATLHLGHGWDMVTNLEVNGKAVDTVNQFTDTVDLAGYLRSGQNTISVKVDTPLSNRQGNYKNLTGWSVLDYGLLSVDNTPFVEKSLSASTSVGLRLGASSYRYGSTTRVTATLQGEGAAGGIVTFTDGGRVLGRVRVPSSGIVSLQLPRTLAAGRHTLTAAFSPSAGSVASAASASTVLTVTKAHSATHVVAKRRGAGKVRVAVTVTVPQVTASGRVTVKVDGRVARRVSLTEGHATVVLRGLARGRHKIVAVYAGSADIAGSRASKAVTITKR